MHHIIGCGGVGSWLAPALGKLVEPKNVELWDGDTFEAKNLDRQLFRDTDIGSLKADKLGERLGMMSRARWFAAFADPFFAGDWLWVCADNNRTRRDALVQADYSGCSVIVGANETYSAEAYIYLPHWREGPRDPRVYMPEIMEDAGLDPMRPRGCVGQAQDDTPQLVSANFMAAALMQHLYVMWATRMSVNEEEQEELEKRLPFRERSSLSRLENII